MIKLALIASLAAVPVSQCARVVVPAGGGGYSAPAARPIQPAQTPIAPGAHTIQSDPGNVEGQRETHSAVNEEDCYQLDARFKREGRNLKMQPPRYVGGQLPWLCIFEGPDAEAGYFDDRRYERDR